jgi:hypothetical protein
MAKGFTDSIGERNVAPFVKQPVIDKSEGYGSATDINAFTNAAKLSTAIYKDVAELNALQGITGEIEDEIKAYESASPSKILEQQQGLQKSEAELAKLPTQESGSAEDVNQSINNVLSDIDSQKQFLSKAKSQDRISGFEFDQRVKQILKDKVTQYPYLKSEILSHGKTILDLNGIENRIKLDDKMATSKAGMDEWFTKEIYKEAKDNNLNLNSAMFRSPDGQLDFNAIDGFNQWLRTAKFGDDALSKSAKRGEDIDKLQLRRAIKDGTFDKISLKRQYTDVNEIEKIFTITSVDQQTGEITTREELSPNELAKAKGDAKKYIQNRIIDAELTFSPYGLNNPEVKERLTRYKDRLNDSLATIENYKNLSDIKTYIDNQKSITENQITLDMRERFGATPEVAGMLEKLANVGNVFGIQFNTVEYVDFIGNINKMFEKQGNTGISSLNEMLNTSPLNKNKSMVQEGIQISLTKLSGATKGTEVANALFDRIEEAFNNQNDSVADKYKLYTETMAGIASNVVTSDDVRSIDTTRQSTLTQSIETTVPQIYNQMEAEANTLGLTVKIDGQGLVIVPGAKNDFNNKYVVPLNNSIKTYGKLMAAESNKGILDSLKTTQQEQVEEEVTPEVVPTQTKQPVETTSTEEVTTAPVEPETPVKETSAKELDLDFVINELGPKESQEGHRDKAGKLIKAYKPDEKGEFALGQFQIKPSTAADPGFGLPSIDLETSSVMEQAQWVQNYLDKLISYYRGDKEKALAAYNYGLGNVNSVIEKHGDQWKTKVPKETREYINDLL